MTSGTKGHRGFKPIYDPEEFKKVLGKNPIRTSDVVLLLQDQNTYRELTQGVARRILLKLAKDGEIEKVEERAGKSVIYKWKKKEE